MELETITWDYTGYKNISAESHQIIFDSDFQIAWNKKELKDAGIEDVSHEEMEELLSVDYLEPIELIELDGSDMQTAWNITFITTINNAIINLKNLCPSDEERVIIVQAHSQKIIDFINSSNPWYNDETQQSSIGIFEGVLKLNKGNMHESVVKVFFEEIPEKYIAIEIQNLV